MLFIAYAIADGDNDLIYEALLLFIHCSQSQTFPTKWFSFIVINFLLYWFQLVVILRLGDLIANCRTEKIIASNLARNCLSR